MKHLKIERESLKKGSEMNRQPNLFLRYRKVQSLFLLFDYLKL